MNPTFNIQNSSFKILPSSFQLPTFFNHPRPATLPSALESAIAHLERSLCPDGTGHAGIPEGEHAGFEWRALFRWAEREGLALPPQLIPEVLLEIAELKCKAKN